MSDQQQEISCLVNVIITSKTAHDTSATQNRTDLLLQILVDSAYMHTQAVENQTAAIKLASLAATKAAESQATLTDLPTFHGTSTKEFKLWYQCLLSIITTKPCKN